MPTKQILFGEEARKAIKTGVDIVANAVKVSLGAKGRCVVIGNKYRSSITKDGYTICRAILLSDEIEVIGANIIKEISLRTVSESGDGTTTATILGQAIVNEGFKLLSAGHNPMELNNGIDKAVNAVFAHLKEISIPIDIDSEKLNQIAVISANNDEEIGLKVAEVVKKTGVDGMVTIDDSDTGETYIKLVEGMQIEGGFVSPLFINHEGAHACQIENCYVLLSARKLSTKDELIPILNKLVLDRKPILVIAEDIEQEALGILLAQKIQGNYPCVAIRTPGFGDNKAEILKDLSILTGAKIINDETGIKVSSLTINDLGYVDKVLVTRYDTTIVGGAGKKEKITGRIEHIRRQITGANEYDKQNLEKRLAKLLGGVGIIFVGGASGVELGEKKDRVDDALRATRAAIEEGIVAGGGIALIRCIECLNDLPYKTEDEKAGIKLIQRVLEYPLKQMSINAGVDINTRDVKSDNVNYGYNYKTDVFEDLVEAGVIDPAKVVRVALKNAASVAGTLLTSEALLVQVDDPAQNNMMR